MPCISSSTTNNSMRIREQLVLFALAFNSCRVSLCSFPSRRGVRDAYICCTQCISLSLLVHTRVRIYISPSLVSPQYASFNHEKVAGHRYPSRLLKLSSFFFHFFTPFSTLVPFAHFCSVRCKIHESTPNTV